jgi:hypothetical protein
MINTPILQGSITNSVFLVSAFATGKARDTNTSTATKERYTTSHCKAKAIGSFVSIKLFTV